MAKTTSLLCIFLFIFSATLSGSVIGLRSISSRVRQKMRYQPRRPLLRCEISPTLKGTQTDNFRVDDEEISIADRTSTCLDFPFIMEKLKSETVTTLGAEIASSRVAAGWNEATASYAMISELSPLVGLLPLRSSVNVWPVIRAIELNSSPPEQEDLASFTEHIESILELLEFFRSNGDKLTLFRDLVTKMVLPGDLISMFEGSFDDDGNLNADKFAVLGKLRREAETLRGRIVQILQTLLRSQEMKEKLADSGFSEMEGRYCLMLKNTYKRGVGVVHGSSNTGRTLYVEPMEVVEPTNEMKSVLAQLRAEENKILFEMCQCISRHRESIKDAAFSVSEIDVYLAKAKLGQMMGAVIPEVGNEGVIRCVDARHPVLLLRGTDAVGNTVSLDGTNKALVISGPNAGGKTVVLKTAGLFALMAKHTIPIPARSGARVDFLNVMADIGDMQTVSGDLSTFSGHLVVCREMISHAKKYDGHSLVLLDEIGTGTDPAQGAALAQAILEELLHMGTRVIVTTHYQRIKELAADDHRFQIAAMEFVGNRPTYRLRIGSVGESYALEAGRRMGLPEHVLERANILLDDETRRILALQEKLEQETERARVKQTDLDNALKGLADRERAIELSRERLETQIQKLREGRTDEFLVDLRRKEQDLETLLRTAQEAALKAELTRSEREKQIEVVKTAVKAVRTETERAIVEVAAEDIADPLVPGDPIEEGTTLIVLEKGTLFGSRGIVSQRNKGRGRVVLRVAGVEVKMERHLLGRPHRSGKLGFASSTGATGADGEAAAATMSAKDRRMMQMLSDELVDPDKLLARPRKARDGKLSGLRLASNTLDLRGKGLQEAQDLTCSFLERAASRDAKDQIGVVYINHGNIKSADSIKAKLRAWLKKNPLIHKVAPAELSDGGDAFTVLELDLED